MRGRPKLSLYLRPAVAVAGGELTAELVLDSRSETPVEFIALTLRGQEWVGTPSGWDERSLVAQQAKFDARTLVRGEQRVSARFSIPADAPPTHQGTVVFVRYELDVHVSIPWWPDRREIYVLPVTRRTPPPPADAPKVFTNAKREPGDLHVEASLESLVIEPGSTVAGVISFANVAGKRVKSVELEFLPREGITNHGQVSWFDGVPLASTVVERAPREGESIPFRVRFPENATACFTTRRAQLAWRLRLTTKVTFGDDVIIEVPLNVVPQSQRGSALARKRTVLPPVGRERRALLFRAVGQRLGLEVDAEAEELRGDVGAAALVIRLEQREDEGLFAIAELSWPTLGMELALRERRWTDAFGEAVDLDDEAFDKRLHVRAKDPDRARRMFDESTRAALLGMASLELDDEGAVLGRPVRVQSAEAMLEDVFPLHAAAEAVGSAVARVAETAMAYR